MWITDQDTDRKYRLDNTPQLAAELDAFDRSDCQHPDQEIRRRPHRGGGSHFYRQCKTCGRVDGSALKKSAETENAPPYDLELENRFMAARATQRAAIYQKHIRIQRDRQDGFKREYDVYLESAGWQAKRAKVLRRANGICEGCLENEATQVHHLTYRNVFDEFMFELKAVCYACHQRLHAEPAEDDGEPENEWRDGFACDGCRWQDQKGHRRWCGALDIYATDALASGGECGPSQKMLEPLR